MESLWYILAVAGGFAGGALFLIWRRLPQERELAALRDKAAAAAGAAAELEVQRSRAVRAETELALSQRLLEEKLAARDRIHAGEVATLETRLAALDQARLAREKEYREARAEAEKQWRTQIDLLKEEFKSVSAKILEERSGALQNLNNEQLGALLNPLKERMHEFKQAVDEAKLKNVELSTDLKSQIAKVMETTRQIGSEANNLAAALKGNNKAQGNWGEMILETLLENSGLERDVHYEVQSTLRDRDGRAVRNEQSQIMRPDVVVHYPDGRDVVIDSKVSLNAYTDYVNAGDAAAREEHLNLHLKSVQSHVDELARKDYSAYLKGKSLDFVIMFIPNEAPHQLAMAGDPGLWRRAFERKVLIVSPVNLMALLQIISIAWRRDAQERNQEEILKTASQLLDRLYAFYEDFDLVGRKLAEAGRAYDEAVGSLKGGGGRHSVVTPGEKLKKLGVKMKKHRNPPARLADSEEAPPELPETPETPEPEA